MQDHTYSPVANLISLYQTELKRLSKVANAPKDSFAMRMKTEVRMAKGNGWPIALACVSVDEPHRAEYSKATTLRSVKRLLTSMLPPGVYSTLLANNVFAIILPGLDASRTLEICRLVQSRTSALPECEGSKVSVGVTHLSLLDFIEAATPNLLMWSAERALQQARRSESGRVVLDT